MAKLDKKLLHERLADHLRDEIQQSRSHGEKFDTELELADRFDVSVGTVRQAVLTLCNEGLLRRRQGSGTFVRKTTGRGLVAVLTGRHLERQDSYFFVKLASLLQERLDAESLACRQVTGICGAENTESATRSAFVSEVESGKFTGCLGVGIRPRRWLQELLDENDVPLVGASTSIYDYRVRADQQHMIRQAVQFLVERNRRRLGILHPTDHATENEVDDPHVRAFKHALEGTDVPFRRERVFGCINPTSADNGWADFRRLWRNSPARPDGLIICDDCLFRDAAPAILAHDIKVPEDLLIVTHANRGSGVVYPFPTARMEYDPGRFADEMVDMLLDLVNERDAVGPENVVDFRWRGIRDIDRALDTALVHGPASAME